MWAIVFAASAASTVKPRCKVDMPWQRPQKAPPRRRVPLQAAALPNHEVHKRWGRTQDHQGAGRQKDSDQEDGG